MMYGLTHLDVHTAETKIREQELFLKSNAIVNTTTGEVKSLADFAFSSNHNPHRYYAEIQHRIDSLNKEAEYRGLVPVFLTITLPGEFHRMKRQFPNMKDSPMIDNPNYNGMTPSESVKVLTKMFAKLRQDRSLKELDKSERMFYRVNEPHKDGTPHTHILLYIPPERIERVKAAFERLYNKNGNKIETDLRSPKSYVMKYINKTLPRSKDTFTEADRFINAWYIFNRVYRFSSSRSMEPLRLYRALCGSYSLFALTRLREDGSMRVYLSSDRSRISEVWLDGDPVYIHQFGYRTTQNEIGRVTFEEITSYSFMHLSGSNTTGRQAVQ